MFGMMQPWGYGGYGRSFATVRPEFNWNRTAIGGMGYRRNQRWSGNATGVELSQVPNLDPGRRL